MEQAPPLPESDVLTIERDGAVAVVWLDRPEKLNAMGPSFWTDLPAVMAALGADPEVRAVVIAGRGPAFTAGLDLVAFAPMFSGRSGSEAARRQALLAEIKKMQHTFTAVADCPKPVVAAVHGFCLGGGVDLITACDIRLAAADAVFSVRETRLAMVADVGTLQRLPAIIDPGRVAELVFTGRDVSAAEAEAMGLVSHVYPDAGTVHKEAVQLAHEIAANSPLAVQGAKAVLRAGKHLTTDQALDYVAVWNAAFLASNDLFEAMAAHMEKRDPEFTGE